MPAIALSGSDIFVANYQAGTIGEYTTSGATVNASLVFGVEFTGRHRCGCARASVLGGCSNVAPSSCWPHGEAVVADKVGVQLNSSHCDSDCPGQRSMRYSSSGPSPSLHRAICRLALARQVNSVHFDRAVDPKYFDDVAHATNLGENGIGRGHCWIAHRSVNVIVRTRKSN